MLFLIVRVCVYSYLDEDLQTRTGIERERDRERKAAIVKEEEGIVCMCVLLSDEEQKKTHSLARRNYLLLFFYWMASFFTRSFVDEPGRENKKKKIKQASK